MKIERIILVVFLLFLPVQSFAQEIITFTILHSPQYTVSPGRDLKIEATITDPKSVAYASINYRAKGERSFKTVFMTNVEKDIFVASIPAKDVIPPSIEYYIFVMDVKGVPHVIFKDPRLPQVVTVTTEAGLEEAKPTGAALEEEFALFAAEDIVYGAAKREQKIEEAPASVTVMTEEDIEKLGMSSVTELFRYIPGVDVFMLNPSYTFVGARGFSRRGNLMLLLIDGREVNIEFVGMPWWHALPVSIHEIKRIEVIRGPASSLYGANAFSGIVNIVTKDPEDFGRADVKVRGGSYNSVHYFANGGGETGKFSGRLTTEYNQENRWFKPEERSVEGIKLNGRIKYTFEKDKYINLDTGITTGRIFAFTVLGGLDTRGNFRYAKLNINQGDFKTQLYWTGIPIESIKAISPGLPPYYPFEILLPTITGEYDQYELYSQYSIAMGTINRILVGASGRINVFTMNVLPEGTKEEDRVGAFIQDEFTPIENLSLTLGYRFDWNSETPVANSPRATLVWSPFTNNFVRLSYGLAFRKPVFFEYGFDVQGLKDVANISFSNPDLENEELTTYEFGYITRPIEALSLGVSAYYNECRKFIEYIPEEHIHRNIASDADVYGGEFEAKVSIKKNVRLFANFSYLRGIEKAEVILPSHVHPDEANPNYKVSGGLEWIGLQGFFGSIAVSSVDGYKMALTDPNNTKVILFPVMKIVNIDPYTLLTAKIGYRFFKDTFEVGIYGQNLLFKKYSEFPGLIWNRDTDGDGFPDDKDVYGGEEIGTKLYAFVGAKF